VTHLRKLMLEELQRRNYSQNTVETYIFILEEFTKYFHRAPDQLGPEHIRQYQVHLFRERKLSSNSVRQRVAALRFFFVKTLRRHYMLEHIPFPKEHRPLPTVLSQEEVALLIDSASNLLHRAMLMTLYATGMRRAELAKLKVTDIDKPRMVVHIHQGKGNRDRDVPISEKLLETLREYFRWMKPKTYLFPGTGGRTCRSPRRWCGMPASKPPNVPASGKRFRRTVCGTPMRPISWKLGWICPRYRT